MHSIFKKDDVTYTVISDEQANQIGITSDDPNATTRPEFNNIVNVVNKVQEYANTFSDFHIAVRSELYKLNFTLDFINSSKIIFVN